MLKVYVKKHVFFIRDRISVHSTPEIYWLPPSSSRTLSISWAAWSRCASPVKTGKRTSSRFRSSCESGQYFGPLPGSSRTPESLADSSAWLRPSPLLSLPRESLRIPTSKTSTGHPLAVPRSVSDSPHQISAGSHPWGRWMRMTVPTNNYTIMVTVTILGTAVAVRAAVIADTVNEIGELIPQSTVSGRSSIGAGRLVGSPGDFEKI